MKIWYIIAAVFLVSCTTNISEDRLVDQPDQKEDLKLLLSYLDDKERSNRDNPSFFYHRAQALWESGEPEKALEDIEEALLLQENADYYELKSMILMERGSFTRALSAALKAQELGSKRPNTFIAIASAWRSLNDYKRALEAIETAIALLPLDYDLHYQQSLILKDMGELKLSEKALQNALELNPAYPNALYDLVDILSGRESFDSAFQLLEVAARVEGQEKEILRKQSKLYLLKNDLDSAALILNRLKSDPSYRLSSYLDLGQIKYRSYQYDSALYFSRKAVELDSMNIEALLLGARSYDRKRFFQNARSEYLRILEIDSTHQLVQQELDKLNRKVAYLRKLEEERSEVPVVVPLKRKEITN